jgi:predicted DNA-binding transcriptional regulator AlpA
MADASAQQVLFGGAAQATRASPRSEAQRGRRTGATAVVAGRRAPRPRRAAADAGAPELPPDNELWDVHAAVRFLKRSVSWVYHKAEDGTLPVTRLGGWGVRFIPRDLRAWVEAGCTGPRRE